MKAWDAARVASRRELPRKKVEPVGKKAPLPVNTDLTHECCGMHVCVCVPSGNYTPAELEKMQQMGGVDGYFAVHRDRLAAKWKEQQAVDEVPAVINVPIGTVVGVVSVGIATVSEPTPGSWAWAETWLNKGYDVMNATHRFRRSSNSEPHLIHMIRLNGEEITGRWDVPYTRDRASLEETDGWRAIYPSRKWEWSNPLYPGDVLHEEQCVAPAPRMFACVYCQCVACICTGDSE